MRLTWGDGSTVDVGFYAKGEAKSQVAIQHSKLPDAEFSARQKAFWSARAGPTSGVRDSLDGLIIDRRGGQEYTQSVQLGTTVYERGSSHDRYHQETVRACLRQVRARRLQHQQRRADHGAVPRLRGQPGAVHHPDQQGRPLLHQQADARRHDPRRRRDLPGGHFRRASGSRRREDLHGLHRERFLQLRHDRRQPRAVREEHRDHPPGRRCGACARHRGRGGARPVGRRRGARVGQRGRCQADRSRAGQGLRDPLTAATRWPAPSAPATARSSSAARRGCISTCWSRSRSGCPASRW